MYGADTARLQQLCAESDAGIVRSLTEQVHVRTLAVGRICV